MGDNAKAEASIEFKPDDFEVIGKNVHAAQKVSRPRTSFWKDAWRRFKMNKLSMFGLVLLILMIIMAVIGPHLLKFKFDNQDLMNTFGLPGKNGHPFGTDDLGRDLFVRIWHGARLSFIVGLSCALIDLVIGCFVGGIAGYFGGAVDNILMRVVDILTVIPFMLIVILFSLVLKGGLLSIIFALTVTGWTTAARLVRGQILVLKEQEFVLAAKLLGANASRIILKHALPNIVGVLVVQMTLDIPNAIFNEAFLSFIGLGVKSPDVSLGSLVSSGFHYIIMTPSLLFIPAAVLCVMMLSFNFMADGLRDALDPKMRK